MTDKSNIKIENNQLVQEQRKIMIVATSVLIIIGLLVNLFGLTGYQGQVFLIFNIFFLILVVSSLFFVFLKKNPPLLPILIGLLMSIELFVCIESIICAYANTVDSMLTIVANMTILITALLMSILAYLRYTTYILGVITIITYTFCAYITDEKELWGFYILLMLLFGMTAILGPRLTRGRE